jgi:S-adenosylmethionine hydrolase
MKLEKRRISLIATFTDFGPTGPYQGQVAAILATQAATVPRVSLMADAPMFNPQSAGLLLSYLCKDLPLNTLIFAVVDPGVGGDRRPIMIKSERHVLVGPDNGLFMPIIRRATDLEIERITWRPDRLSDTFHGRDLFAPVAAKLATGKVVEGTPLTPQELVGYDLPLDSQQIIYIDHYGNAMTGINAKDIPRDIVLNINGSALRYARTFSEVPAGQAFWYINSMGMVEFAVNCGSAANLLNINLGMPVEL